MKAIAREINHRTGRRTALSVLNALSDLVYADGGNRGGDFQTEWLELIDKNGQRRARPPRRKR